MQQRNAGAVRQMIPIPVSEEMLALVGTGTIGDNLGPGNSVAFEINPGSSPGPASLRFHAAPSHTGLDRSAADSRLILIVTREACERVLGGALDMEDQSMRYLPAEMKAIALAIHDCDMPEGACAPYRLAKSIELLCELLRGHRAGKLTSLAAPATLSLGDARRIAAARKLIDEHWSEKLTLGQIARRCGLNRSKLAKGFRELYDCSVTEALAERRLAEARRQLISTDLPVGLIGYRSGYQNNASFTRAFGRRFGISPSTFRACSVAG